MGTAGKAPADDLMKLTERMPGVIKAEGGNSEESETHFTLLTFFARNIIPYVLLFCFDILRVDLQYGKF